MADDSIQVQIGVDASGTKPGAQEASAAVGGVKDAFNGATVSAKDFAAALAQSGNDMSKAAKLALDQADGVKTAAAQLKGAASTAREASSAYSSIASGANEAAKGHEHLSMASAGAKRELIVLAHEMSQGNYTRLGGSLMVLAERMGGLSGPAMAGAAAIGALGYAAYEIIKNIAELNSDLRDVSNTMALMGRSRSGMFGDNVALEVGGLKSQITDLANTTGLAADDAAKVRDAVESLGTASDKTRTNLERLGPVYAVLSKKDPVEATQGLAAAFSSFGGMDSLATKLNLFTVDQRKAFDAAKDLNDVLKAQDITMGALKERLDPAQGFSQQTNKSSGAFSMVSKPQGAAPTGDAPDQAPVRAYEEDQKRLVADTRQALSEVQNEWTGSKVEFEKLAHDTWQSVVDSQRLSGQQQVDAERELSKTLMAEKKAGYAQEVAESKAHVAEMQASGTMSKEQVLKAQIAENQKLLADFQGNADERRSLETETNVLVRQLNAETNAQQLRRLQEVAAATKTGSQERIQAETDAYEYAVKTWGEYSSQAKTAYDSVVSATNAWVTKDEEIQKRRTQIQMELANIARQGQLDALDAEVADGEITTQEKIAQLRQITDATYEENIAQLQSTLATQHEGEAAYEETAGKLAVLAAQNARDHEALDRQMAQADKQSAQESGRAWTEAVSPITTAFDSMTQGVMMGTQTIGQAMKRMAADIVISFAEAIAKMLIQFGMFKLAQAMGWTEIASATAASQGALSAAVLGKETAMTAATVEGNTVRTAAVTGSQVAQTAAVSAGEGARTAETVAGEATQGAATESGIMKHAASAAAAVYDDVAQIPYVGWLLAPPAAAAAFSGVAAFGDLPSFDVGTSYVPHDMVAQIHEGERILTANENRTFSRIFSGSSLRVSGPSSPLAAGGISGGGQSGSNGGSSGGDTVHVTIQANDAASINNMMQRPAVANAVMQTIRRQLANGSTLGAR